MKEVLDRIHNLLTGVYVSDLDDSRKEIEIAGSGTLAGVNIIMGWDKIQGAPKSSLYPYIVIEPDPESGEYGNLGLEVLTVSIDINVRVKGRTGSLFGNGAELGVEDISSALKDLLLDRENQKLKKAGVPYTVRIESYGGEPSIMLNGGGYISIRMKNFKFKYTRKYCNE